MSLETLGKVVAKVAPLLGGALAGPAGAAIGSLVAAQFGGDINNPQNLIQRIEADPQASTKLLELQSNNQVELQRLYVVAAQNELKYAYLEKANEYQDRNSARQREADLAKAGQKDKTPAILAYTLTAGVLAALAYLFMHEIPNDNKELIVSIISALTTVWIGAMAYYHGSSAGSRLKDNALAHQETKQLALPKPPVYLPNS